MHNFHRGHIIGVSAVLVGPVAVFVSKALAPLFIVTAVVALAAEFLREKKFPPMPRPFAWLFVLVIVWGLVSALWSPTPARSLYMALPLGGIYLGGLVLASVASRLSSRERRFFEKAIIAGGVLTLLILAIEVFSPLALTRLLVPIVKGHEITIDYTFRNFFKSGATISAILIWPFAATLWRRGFSAGSLLFVAVLSLVLVYSRSGAAIIGLVVGFSAFAVAWFFRLRSRKILSVAIIAAVVAMPVIPRLLPSADTIEKDAPYLPNSVFPRVFIWQSAVGYIMENPFFGRGLDTSRAISSAKDKVSYSTYPGNERRGEPIPLHPHNAILQVWLELGAVGAVLLLAVLLALVRRIDAIGATDERRFLRAVYFGELFSIIAIASVSYGIWQNWWLGAIWLAVTFSVASLSEDAGE